MPGWYIHMEAAKVTAQRLQHGDVPPQLQLDPNTARDYGEICHRWRNFLAMGSLAPDMFYLLPDFQKPWGQFVFNLIDTIKDLWEPIDELFVGPWEKWMGPAGANDADLTNGLTGGLSNPLAQALDEVVATVDNVWKTLLTRFGDIFGLLTSGVPRGLGETSFYWSDMFHYRRTYDFPRQLLDDARRDLHRARRNQAALAAQPNPSDADAEQARTEVFEAESNLAFAIGWITHCATDVTGHPFTNAKCGGPFRLHWGRHHLVENHFDAAAYDIRHHGNPWYGSIDTSAMHFWIAPRYRTDAPYLGCMFAPAYDYFTGLPQYPIGDSAGDTLRRERFFDMDSGDIPPHLAQRIIATMKTVYYTNGDDHAPRVMEFVAGKNDAGTGRPNGDALNTMWSLVFLWLRMMSRGGLHPPRPQPPTVSITPFPIVPGGGMPAEDDGRGADPAEDDEDDDGFHFNLFDLLLAIIAIIMFLVQVVVWLATVLPNLVLNVLTFPAREFLYYNVVAPLYELYMVSRKLLVLTGFFVPKPEEIEEGLVTLGRTTGFQRQLLSLDLNDPTGFSNTAPGLDEPSGLVAAGDEYGADPAFPRQTVTDPVNPLQPLIRRLGVPIPAGPRFNSHWLAPWTYPETGIAGERTGWEPHRHAPGTPASHALTHPGPWLQGDRADALLRVRIPTDLTAATRFESAITPDDTETACHDLLPNGQHLGNPVDYSLYLISQMVRGAAVPNFNLDSDHGYGWRCWDWDRHVGLPDDPTERARIAGTVDDFHVYGPFVKRPKPPLESDRFDFEQPCTVPEQFNADWAVNHDPVREPVNRYRPRLPLWVHYLDDPEPRLCGGGLAEAQRMPELQPGGPEVAQAGMLPDGQDG